MVKVSDFDSESVGSNPTFLYIILILTNKYNLLCSNIKKNFLKKIHEIKILKFRDSESYIEIKNKVTDKVILVYSIYGNINDRLSELFMILFMLKDKKVKLIIPYFPYSRQDKIKDNRFNCLAFNFVIYILSKLSLLYVYTIDLHSNFFFNTYNIKFFVLKTLVIIKKICDRISYNGKLVLVFPDYGSFNRYKKLSMFYRYFVFKKKRLNNKIFIETKNKIFSRSCNYLVVDDILDSGNTIKEVLKYFKTKKIRNVYLYCTHLLINKDRLDKIFNNYSIKFLYSTDTLEKKDIKNKKKLKIISVSKIFKGIF